LPSRTRRRDSCCLCGVVAETCVDGVADSPSFSEA
jgi:hypothetical protein